MPSEETVNIPSWFIKFLGWASCLFLGVFIPWASWMSIQVVDLKSEMSGIINVGHEVYQFSKDLESLKNRVEDLEN